MDDESTWTYTVHKYYSLKGHGYLKEPISPFILVAGKKYPPIAEGVSLEEAKALVKLLDSTLEG